MEFDAFGFFVSIINFGVMFVLFNYVVIVPMEGAVALRGKKVQTRLDEIRLILTQAQKMEAEVQQQFARLDNEKQEMREAAAQEIARVQKHLLTESQRDAEHLVGKTARELEKNRVDALAALNRLLAKQAMSRVEGLLTKAFDAQAQQASAEAVMGKVARHAD